MRELLGKDLKLSKYIHPYLGGTEMLHKIDVDRFVIDIDEMDMSDASIDGSYAFEYLKENVLPERENKAREEIAKNKKNLAENPKFRPDKANQLFMSRWWQLWRRRADLLAAVSEHDRYIATSRHTTINRTIVFEFVDGAIRPGDSMTVIPFSDDYSFGVVSSKVHREWIKARCSTFKGDPRYTSTTVWESFPWPQAPTQEQVSRIVEVTERLLVHRVNVLARGVTLGDQYDVLRTPGNTKLGALHDELDEAVMDAYGFSDEDDLRTQIFALNLDLAAEQESVRPPGPSHFQDVRRTNYRLSYPVSLPS